MKRQEAHLLQKLENRKKIGTYRSLQTADEKIDFWSNDYLGFARSRGLKKHIKSLTENANYGAIGSRLISGNPVLAESLEQEIAQYHNAESALIFNSGYDANLGIFSCIAAKEDTIFYDDLVHASIHDGLKLSRAKTAAFQHNNLQDLEEKLVQKTTGNAFIAVESVYSMDGDVAPLKELVILAEKYGAAIIIDEAHGMGIFGKNGGGLVDELGLEKYVFARIHTYGKSMGAHGAAILGSETLRNYLMNYARSFIFTTALPPHSLLAIKSGYFWLEKYPELREKLQKNITFFIENAKPVFGGKLLKSETAIQGIIVPGNENAKRVAEVAQKAGFAVKAIVFPTVAKGEERIRVCLHAFNTEAEILGVIKSLNSNSRYSRCQISIRHFPLNSWTHFTRSGHN